MNANDFFESIKDEKIDSFIKQEIKEYHKNGNISYEETILIIPKEVEYLFPNRVTHKLGFSWIRIGINSKYHENGVLAWSIKRDDNGEAIEFSRQKRKDGTFIIY